MISARSVFVACSHGSQEPGVERSENFILMEVAKRVLGKTDRTRKKGKSDNYTEVLKLGLLTLFFSLLGNEDTSPHHSHAHSANKRCPLE